jgi:hypothetical protein
MEHINETAMNESENPNIVTLDNPFSAASKKSKR